MFLHCGGFNKFYQTHLVDAANSEFDMPELIEAELHDGCEDVKDTAAFWFEDKFGMKFYGCNEALTEDEEQHLDHSKDPAEDQVNYLNAGNNQHYNGNYSTLEKRTACQEYISHHGGATATNVIGSYVEDRAKVTFKALPDPLRALRTINILIERDKSTTNQ
jgi:hypothetical protein